MSKVIQIITADSSAMSSYDFDTIIGSYFSFEDIPEPWRTRCMMIDAADGMIPNAGHKFDFNTTYYIFYPPAWEQP